MAPRDFLKGLGNAAYELSGVGDIKRGAREIAKGNYAGGLGRIALGSVGFLPVVGGAGRAALAAGKIASKTAKVTPKASGRVTSALNKTKIKGVVPAKTKVGKFTSDALTSPYAVSRVISPLTITKPLTASAQPLQQGQQGQGAGQVPQVNTSRTSTGGTGSGTQQGGSRTGSTSGGTAGGSFDPAGFRQGEEADRILLETGTESTGLGGGMAAPLPGTVQAEGLDYLAGVSGAAAASRARQYNISDEASRAQMSARGQAADIYGGRAPGIRGQLLTGVQRMQTQDLSKEVQQRVSEFGALERSYGKAVADAFAAEAKKIKDTADARSSLVAQMKGIG